MKAPVKMKLFLIVLAAITAIASQTNLKLVAPFLPTSIQQAIDLGYIRAAWLFFRVFVVSGLSLLVTVICYRFFGFLEFMVAQSLVYVLAVAVSYCFFDEPLYLNRIAAVVLILCGIGLYTVK